VCTSQETHYVSATKPNQLVLFGETVAVYCEKHTEHTDTLCGQNEKFWYVTAGGTYSNHWIGGIHGRAHGQQCDFISLLYFFKIRKVG
jgi:hypothetical protein